MTVPRKRNFRKFLGMNPCQEHNLFVGIKCLLKIIAAKELGTIRKTIRLIPTEDLEMRNLCAKKVPKNLTEQQRTLLKQVESNPGLLNRVIKDDES